jgi:hypothetical protein
MKLFAASLIAQKRQGLLETAVRSVPAVISTAKNKMEAEETALGLAQSAFPSKEGWINHQIAVMEIPKEMIEKAAIQNP